MGTTALVGRDIELSMLQAFCRGVDPSAPSLLLRGEPGVGKTALLGAITDWAAAQGFKVLHANGVRAEVETGFSTLNQLLLPLECWMPRLRPNDQQALSEALGFVDGSSPESCAIAAAAMSLLCLAAADQPVLLVVDDVQWADRLSAQVLNLLIPGLPGGRTKFLGAFRFHDAGFLDNRTTPSTQVLPLQPVAAAELLNRQFPNLSRRERDWLAARGEGNPLALLELPPVLGTSPRGLSHTPRSTPPISRRIQRAFTADIQALPAETSRLLLLLALEGTGELTLWHAAAGPPELAPAEQAGLVSVDATTRRLTFAHPLIPFTIIGLATSDDRRTAHQQLSQLLESRPERQAPHLAEATTGPDETVAAKLEAAAPLIAREGGAAASVAIYLRSAALSENLTNRARRFVRAAHLVAAATGDVSTGLELLREATRCDPAVVATLRYAMALSVAKLHGRGDADTAHRALVDALGAHLAHPDGDRGTLVEATQVLLDLCLWTQRPEHWTSLCAILTELRIGEGVLVRLQAAALIDPLRALVGPFTQLEGGLERQLTDASDTSLTRIAECALHAGRFEPYRDRVEAVVADGRERGGTAAAIDALCCLAHDAYLTSEWDRAQILAEEGLAWCDRLGCQLHAWTLLWVKALVDAGRGDLPAVRKGTEEMLQWAERHQINRVRNYALHARALAALSCGEFERAYQVATAVAPAENRPPRGPETLEVALCAVEAALHTYRGDEAARQVQILGADIGVSSPRAKLLVAAATAMGAHEQDRAPLFERALADQEAAHYPFDLARVHLAYGQHLRRSRATGAARPHLRKALEIFERLNAWPWVERTRIELDASGQTRQQVRPGLALTSQERTVALLAASGHTNKQIAEKLFLTHRTVAAHLHQVFPKLGVDSRAGLRDALDLKAQDPLPQDRFLSQKGSGQQGADRLLASRRPRAASLVSR